MGEHVAQRDVGLAVGRELGPVARDRRIEIELSAFDQRVNAGGGHALGGGEDEHQRVRGPLPPGPGVRDTGPVAVGVNCVPASDLRASLTALRSCGLDFLVYANLGAPAADGSHAEKPGPTEFAAEVSRWALAGAAIVGGCCGTQPDHIRAAADTLTARTPTDG